MTKNKKLDLEISADSRGVYVKWNDYDVPMSREVVWFGANDEARIYYVMTQIQKLLKDNAYKNLGLSPEQLVVQQIEMLNNYFDDLLQKGLAGTI